MPKGHRVTGAATGGQIDQGARNGSGGPDGHRCGAHHGVVQLAHRKRTRVQIDVAHLDLLAAGGHVVLRRGDEGDLGCVLAGGRLINMFDQTHAHRAVRADRLEAGQRALVLIDGRLQLGAGVAQVGGVEEDGGNAGGDHGHREAAHPRHVQRVGQVAGGEHGAAIGVVGRVDELQRYLGGREGHPIQLEVTVFLHLAIDNRHMRKDGLADVGLPDADGAGAVVRNPRRVNEAVADREWPHGSAEIAAVAAPVHEGGVDGDLAVQIVDIVIGYRCAGDDHALAGAGRRAAHAVGVLAVGIGRADHAHQQRITRRARHLGGNGQVLQAEEHAFAGAAAHVGGGNAELG